jgi:sulfatase maturation enzyme AslB (radical SAM superfamily)
MLYPGQRLPESVFNVFFTICCGKIKTLTDSNSFGHKDIAYDINQNIYLCSKPHKKISSSLKDFTEFEKQKKEARKKRKDFNYLPCRNNPVLSISIRGFMLIYDKTQR